LPKINNIIEVIYDDHLVGASIPLRFSLWRNLSFHSLRR